MSENLRVRCVVCGEVLCYTQENAAPLLHHLCTKHPCLSMACLRQQRSENQQSSENKQTSPVLNNAVSVSQCIDNSLPCMGCGDTTSKNLMKESPKSKRRTVYSTTVETLRAGTSAILCSKCGHQGQPIQRRCRKKSSYSSLEAFCLLGCWPSCFLPLLMCSRRDTVNLYCAQCNELLGTLDEKSKIVTKRKYSKMTVSSAPEISS